MRNLIEVLYTHSTISDKEKHRLECLQQLFGILKKTGYSRFQYVPSRKSWLGIFKEPENLLNLALKKRNLLFYYSIHPGFYKWLTAKGKKVDILLFEFFFENKPVAIAHLKNVLPEDWLVLALSSEIVYLKEKYFYSNYCIIPFMQFLIVSDVRHAYSAHQLYEDLSIKNRVWIGSDSTKFASLNRKYLAGRKFRSGLELGSGTGIQLLNIAGQCDRLTAVDINPKAVQYTSWNAHLNEIGKLIVHQSDLYEKINEQYDLIISNPWFIDLDKAGMEEIPDILKKLDHYLEPKGTFVLIFGSFVTIKGEDIGLSYLLDFVQQNNYDVWVKVLGKGIEPKFLSKYKQNNLSHSIFYYALLKKNGAGKVIVQPSSIFRQFRDEVYVSLVKLFNIFK